MTMPALEVVHTHNLSGAQVVIKLLFTDRCRNLRHLYSVQFHPLRHELRRGARQPDEFIRMSGRYEIRTDPDNFLAPAPNLAPRKPRGLAQLATKHSLHSVQTFPKRRQTMAPKPDTVSLFKSATVADLNYSA